VVWDAQHERGRQPVIKPETAYEVHSCLVDALESGTGKAAHAQFGLKKFPAAGKTGTAYDFTDALFAGYDSAITCAVWAGFDKPQKIYRGAFGREIALPVWVNVMNASVEHYPPKEIVQPPALKKVEICSRSGLLATDRCYDSVKNGPDTIQRRTTYMEIGTPAQLPTDLCNVHGEGRAQLVREASESEFPRAAPAVDLHEVRPVLVKGPTLLAEKDPYNSAKATVKPSPTPEPENQIVEKRTEGEPAEVSTPIPKAIPVASPVESPMEIRRAIPQPTENRQPVTEPEEIRKAVPVGPLDEIEDNTLLKSATPPPTDLDQ
jgi:membrane peptidoglycan carboxypeptidase